MRLIFETHATSLDNERLVASGHFDVELSPLGRAQAAELGVRYRAEDLDAVLCSDLQRSYRTAEIAFAGRGLPVHRDARIRECDYGAWTGRPAAEIDAERVRRIFEPFPAGESYVQVAARMRDLLSEVARDCAGRRVLIIGHRATWYSLEHVINGRDLRDVIAGSWKWQPGWSYRLDG
jgi:broad specificity phosphatase PhoE